MNALSRFKTSYKSDILSHSPQNASVRHVSQERSIEILGNRSSSGSIKDSCTITSTKKHLESPIIASPIIASPITNSIIEESKVQAECEDELLSFTHNVNPKRHFKEFRINLKSPKNKIDLSKMRTEFKNITHKVKGIVS